MCDLGGEPWLELIGLEKESEDLTDAFSSNGIDLSTAEVKLYKNDTILYNLYDQGLSFTFIKNKLESVDFYQTDRRFKCINSSLDLPYGITLDYTGEMFVAKFGEPRDRGGGWNSGIDIWFRYKHLQVDIDDKSWENASSSRWKAITLF